MYINNIISQIYQHRYKLSTIAAIIITIIASNISFAQISIPNISVGVNPAEASPQNFSTSIQILLVLTVLTLAPSILVMMTCFTRIVVVFHFLRTAMGTATQPPNQLLTSFAFFITIFVMQPVLNEANTKGLQPYLAEEISQSQAIDNMITPFRDFMLKHTREEDLGLFIRLTDGDEERPNSIEDVSI